MAVVRKTTRRPAKVTAPKTRRINNKIVPFTPNGTASDLLSLNSLPHIIESIAFWHQKLNRMICPQCHILGTLRAMEEQYGIRVTCAREDYELCSYAHEYIFPSQV